MNLLKKFLTASVSAIAIFATVVTMASAAELTMTATPAEDLSYVDLTLSASGSADRIMGIGSKIAVDQSKFSLDLSFNDEDYSTYLEAFLDGAVEAEGVSTALNAKRSANMKLQIENNILTSAYVATDTANSVTMPTSQSNIWTLRLTVIDGANSSIWKDGYTFTMTDCDLSDIAGNNPVQGAGLTVNEAVIEAAGGNNEPEITQNTITTEDATDAAVYAFTEVAGATGQKLTVVANRNNEAEDITRTFTLPAKVEATVAVGIVVQYNPQEITSFTIKSMTIGE